MRCRFIFARETLFGQNLVDAFAFGKIVDEFVEVAHILHERFVEGSNTDFHKVVFARIGTICSSEPNPMGQLDYMNGASERSKAEAEPSACSRG